MSRGKNIVIVTNNKNLEKLQNILDKHNIDHEGIVHFKKTKKIGINFPFTFVTLENIRTMFKRENIGIEKIERKEIKI